MSSISIINYKASNLILGACMKQPNNESLHWDETLANALGDSAYRPNKAGHWPAGHMCPRVCRSFPTTPSPLLFRFQSNSSHALVINTVA